MPGLSFTILNAPPNRPRVDDTGTGFAVGLTEDGDAATPTLVTSLKRFEDEFGERSVDSALLYDAVESFFAEGGSRLYIASTIGGSGDDYEAALDSFSIHLGPGQVFVPGVTDADTHDLLLDHAAANNRRAVLDGPNTANTTTLAAAASALASGANARYGALWGNWPVIRGLTASTTRTVAPSGVIAGMIARSDRSFSPNQPAAGLQTLPRTVLDLAQAFTDAQVDTLATGHVNVFHSAFGVLQNYGWRSLAVADSDPGWWQFSNSRLVMAIVAKALVVSQRYLFAEIDGQRKKLGQFEGDLIGEAFLPYYTVGSLYGATPDDAFTVDATSTEANPDADLADGQVRALCAVRPSPFAETIEFEIVNVPISQTLAA